MLGKLFIFAMALGFGFTLSRSGASDYDFIQKMFLFQDFQLYGIIGTGVAITAPGLILLKRYGKTLDGDPLIIKPKPLHRGTVVGGILFGIGWSMTGMCPGPILVNIGEGKMYAFGALAGTLLGAYGLGAVYPRIQKAFRLPSFDVGSSRK
jgi:uncharacterized membrane protein YedE/YeeE